MIALLLALVVFLVLGFMLRTYRNRPRFFRRPVHPEPISHASRNGLTPAMAWAGITKITRPPRYFRAWEGVLTGFVHT